MEKNIFAQWDNAVNVEDLQKDIQAAAENGGGTYKEVPHGTYEVSIEKMDLILTKKTNKPMLSVWFNIVEGDYEGQKIFMNHVIDPDSEWRGYQLHKANEFLRSLIRNCEGAPEVGFTTFAKYKNLIMDIHELIAESFEYGLKYGQTKKGFDTFEITDVFALEN